MRLSYDKLWNLMHNNKMRKGDLYIAAKISPSVARKIVHNEPVHLKYIMNLCKIFHCGISDIVEIIEN